MPLYEYHCQDCSQDFEKIVRFAEADQLPPCPSCGSQQTHKKVSAAATVSGKSGSPSFGACASGTCGLSRNFS